MFMIKKTSLFILLPLLISSCANISFSDASPLLKAAIFGYQSKPVTLKEFSDAQYSFAVVKFERGTEARLVLSSVNENGLFKWVGGDGVIMYTLNGKILKTAGLSHNFELLDWKEPVSQMARKNLVLFKNPNGIFTQEISRGSEVFSEIDFHYEGVIKVKFLKERLAIRDLRLKQENLYWFDNTGMVKRSIQHLNPKTSSVTLDFFYKF